ncbi:hypothetical protein BC939DRAFT_307146 [Gamsiella multidivaricata]|uniref:uncharacterized protein n=1 Tax=Gamsiella multidivaricata TaxID=101098 RepID=UPI0022205B84|nr:uncharacterized protein BC939DRAFT_307146 [Gamsiella multidivaricata]KAG0356143.1 hypothetical protein BGZ54_000824 [Gamsiella multidivaricata]KAI7818105.1 hypothetical protein BC939DRAFT_307146 [Gamsiella multidivaricata]
MALTTQQNQQRSHQPSSWWARTLVTLAVLATGTQAACISLGGSTACPSYAGFQVDNTIVKTVAQYGIIMPAFTNVAEFDQAVFNATGFQTASDCTGYNSTVRIPYQNTVLCTIAVLDATSLKCKGGSTNTNTTGTLCDSSCTLYQQGLRAMVDSRCPKATDSVQGLADVTTICSRKDPASWGGLQDTSSTCVNSLQNEIATCGLGSVVEKCTFCRNSTNTTAECCKDMSQCPAPSPTITGPSTTSPYMTPPTNTMTHGNDPPSSNTGSSSKTLGAIIGGSVAGVLVLAIVAFLCIRRSRRATNPKGGNLSRQVSSASGRYNISAPKLQEEGLVSAAPIPMTTLPPIKAENSSFGMIGAATGAAAAGAGAKVGAGREATGKQSYCQALYPYQASMADELDLTPGDIINVQRVFDDGWAVGVNMNTSNEGAFPVVCVMFVDESALDDDFEDMNIHSMTPMTLREEDEGRRSTSGRNSPRSSLPSRSSSPVHLPRRNSSIRDSTVIISGSNPMTSSPLAGGQGSIGRTNTPPVIRDTMMSDASSINRWWGGEK